ncbi:MAG: NAD(P)-binding protein, partial [Pseudomonadota bacterium]
MEGLSVFLCTGCEIENSLKLDGFDSLAKEHGASSFTAHPCLCSEEGTAIIRKAIDESKSNRILIAACSPREKVDEFSFDKEKVVTERVGLREQVVWSHPPNNEDTQALAEDLMRMGLAKAAKTVPPTPIKEEISRTVLVVGSGIAGLCAAQAAARMGHPVVLLEAQERLGGHIASMKDWVPDSPPYNELHLNNISELINAINNDPNIRVFTSTRVKRIAGQPGQFEVEIQGPFGIETFDAGAIVQATGARPYDAKKLTHLGYDQSPNVVTSQELETMLVQGKLVRPFDGQSPNRVAFIQCAGSRDKDHLPYCSSECCAISLKQMAVIQRDFPGTECAIVYRDLRTPGQLEYFYLAVQEKTQSLFVRGEVEQVQVNGQHNLSVQIKESLLGEHIVLDADLVVLAVG